MNKKKLYLHIGTHKTGSTTIQNVLKREREHLLKEDIFYLGRFRDISKPMKEMTEYDEKHVREFQQLVGKIIEKHTKKSPLTYIASNEKWSGHDMLAYSNAGVNARMLRDIFKPFKFDIKIVVFLRRQDKFYESAYVQKVKRGASYTYRDFLGYVDSVEKCHWDSFLDTYADQFGKENIIVQPFDKKYLPHKNSLIQIFGSIVDSQHLKNYELADIKNKGYSDDILEIVRLSNKYLKKNERKALENLLTEVDLPKKYSFLTLEERKILLSQFEESNKKVAQKYVENGNESLFSTDDLENGDLKNVYKGLTPEALAVVFAKIILVLNKQLSEQMEETRKMQFSNRVKRTVNQVIAKIR